MKGIVTLLLVIALLALAFAIGSQNESVVTVNYLIAQADLRLSTLIAIAVSIGIIVGLLIMLVSWLGLRMQLIAARSRIKKLTKE
ncbi:LapA family protein [Aestuariibacter sp. A3R04]|uniref:LapA family protein n=1 Tax=Aestuariibacter sp. A3R04 TaxID=2841571 RepID=UPI001C081F9A|nr:LapA family protein [Aestuariibacter sp. A3R04]MBU3022815.1 LapA family protein [Aestuariibacter sp. A3R04]